ncbi:MAG: recombination-associated protein RdgC [Desulfovibrionales bacterium]
MIEFGRDCTAKEKRVGFLNASTSFTRYVLAEKSVLTGADIAERLKKHAFQDIDESAEERSFGWVSFEDMLDTQWKTAPPDKGEYLAFALRLDTRRVPPAVMKKHLQLALEQYKKSLGEKGREHISREERKEIQEQVQLRLMARTLPIPAIFDVVWNVPAGRIYFGSTRDKVQEMFEEMFFHTFNLRILPLNSYLLARQHLDAKRFKVIEDAEPAVFI